MKKWAGIFLALTLALGGIAAVAAEEAEWTMDWNVNRLIGYSGTGGDVVIPARIQERPVEVIGLQPFARNDALTSVAVPEGCLAVADMAFMWCERLERVTLPQTLQVIGEQAFYRSGLTEICIPAAVGFMDDGALGECKSLAAITFEGEVPHFGGSEVFSGIAPSAVFNVPDDRIDAYVAALPEGANVQPSGKNVVTVSYLADEADFVFDVSTGAITACSSTAPIIEIPAEIGGVAVTAIGDSAFYWNETLYRIDIPEGVTAIENQAFDAASVLVEVNLPSTLKTIGDSALTNYYGEKLVLPDGLESIGASAFEDSSLTELFIGAELKEIGEDALAGCDDLVSITLDAAASDELLQLLQAQVDALELECTVARLAGEEPAAPAADASAYLGDWYLIRMEYDGMQMNPASMGMLMTLTLHEDGSAGMSTEGEEPDEMAWTLDDDGLKIGEEGEWMLLKTLEDGTLSLEEDDMIMAFGREAPEAPENDWASSPVVEATADQLWGVWTLDTFMADGMTVSAADMGMEATLTIGRNVVQMDMMGDVEAMEWTLESGALVVVDELTLCLHENGMLSLEEDDGSMWFGYTGMYDEEPVLPGQNEAKNEPEVSETEAPAVDMDAGAYLDDWYLILMEEEGMQIDPAEYGLVMSLTLNEDGSAALTAEGEEPDEMMWTLDAGSLKIGGEGEWLAAKMQEDGTLSVEEDGSRMVFGRTASEEPEAAPLPVAEPSADYADRMGVRYVMVSAEMSGYAVSPAQMGGLEYALVFREDGTCDFVIAGTALPLTWTPGTAQTQSGTADAFLIDYYGTTMSAVVTDAGFDMNYMDSMLIHYEAEE